jgi:hypothetical protein
MERTTTRLEQATTNAVVLMEQFSEQDPHDPDSAWSNPQEIFDQLDAARKEVMDAWRDVQVKAAIPSQEIDDTSFRVLYLDMITDAYADVLDQLRKDDIVDVNVLIDCLQSGVDFLTSEEKELFLQDVTMEEEGGLTPHEKRRRALGFYP